MKREGRAGRHKNEERARRTVKELKNPLGKLGSGKLKLKLKLKSYPVPKSLHVSYLIFCYKLKDFNDTLDDGDDDRSANWNCLLKVRITEQARESTSTRRGTRDWGLGTGDRARPAPWSSPSERPNKRKVDSRSRHLDGCENATQWWTTGKTNRMRCVHPLHPTTPPHPWCC